MCYKHRCMDNFYFLTKFPRERPYTHSLIRRVNCHSCIAELQQEVKPGDQGCRNQGRPASVGLVEPVVHLTPAELIYDNIIDIENKDSAPTIRYFLQGKREINVCTSEIILVTIVVSIAFLLGFIRCCDTI